MLSNKIFFSSKNLFTLTTSIGVDDTALPMLAIKLDLKMNKQLKIIITVTVLTKEKQNDFIWTTTYMK